MYLPTTSRRLFILILMEDDGHSQPLTLQLRTQGHEVFVARGEDQAARMLLIHAADVLIVDTRLDSEDGYTVASRLCAPLRRRPVLIGITQHDMDSERSHAQEFDHRLRKPIDVTALTVLLSQHAETRVTPLK